MELSCGCVQLDYVARGIAFPDIETRPHGNDLYSTAVGHGLMLVDVPGHHRLGHAVRYVVRIYGGRVERIVEAEPLVQHQYVALVSVPAYFPQTFVQIRSETKIETPYKKASHA